ncbi:hypothetical protein JCM3765_001684 [Sporobolomyces pararoseus]
MPPKRKAATTKNSSPKPKSKATQKKSTTTTTNSKKKRAPPPPSSSSEQESDSDSSQEEAPPPKKKSKPVPTTTTKSKPTTSKKKAPAPSTSTSTKGKSKAKEQIIISDSSDEEDEESEEEVVKSKAKGKAKGKSTTTKAKSPPKKKSTAPATKNKKMVLSDSDDDSSDSDVVIQEAPPKKKPVVSTKKAKTSTSSSSKVKANSPPTPSEHTPPVASTSTKSTKSKKPVKAAPPPPPPKPVTFEEALQTWFTQFVDQDEDESKVSAKEEMVMGGEGIEKLFEQMELSMDGVLPFLLAWNVGAEPGTFGIFKYKDFERTFKPLNIRDSKALATHLENLKTTLYSSQPQPQPQQEQQKEPVEEADIYYLDEIDEDGERIIAGRAQTPPTTNSKKDQFSSFYEFLFPFLKEEGQKSLPKDMAITVLSIVLGEKYKLGKEFAEFAQEQGDKFKSVSQDVWTQLLEFIESVGEDLKGWSEMDAWPSTIDQFVEWKQARDGNSTTA